jgi:hypothetical protein
MKRNGLLPRYPGRKGLRCRKAAALLAGLAILLSACALLPTPLPPADMLPAPTAAPDGPSYAHVLLVRASEETGGTWRFEVTVQHADEGPEHYADQWELLIPLADGQTLSYARPIAQPHPQEQPFTTSLAGIRVPAGSTRIQVRAHDNRDGYGGQEVGVDLEAGSGPGFQVVRK